MNQDIDLDELRQLLVERDDLRRRIDALTDERQRADADLVMFSGRLAAVEEKIHIALSTAVHPLAVIE